MTVATVYAPQPVVLVDGIQITGVLSVNIVNTRSFCADTFAVTVAIAADGPGNSQFWSGLQTAYVELRSPDHSMLLVSGNADYLSIDVINGTVRLEGRDLSSMLIETCPQQDFVNQTAAEVVAFIALKHGLLPYVTPTIASIGRYFNDDYTLLSLSKYARLRTEWDLIVQLARECLFDAYVRGRALYFGPFLPRGSPIRLGPETVSALRMDRMLWIAPIPVVQVNSWNAQDMTAYGQLGTTGTGNTPYVFTGMNLTALQVTEAAARYVAEIGSLRERIILEMPWNIQILPQDLIQLAGFNSAVDGSYRIGQVEKHYNCHTGSYQVITTSA